MPNIETTLQTISNSRRTLFILCGLPYAGKSFVAEALRSESNIAYVSIDDIFHSRGFDWDTNTLPNAHEWQEIFSASYEATQELLQDGKNVLYDSTNHTRASRDALREAAASVGADTYVVYVQSPAARVWRRWRENDKNHDRAQVSKELVEETIDMFEEPKDSERVLVIDNP